MTLQEQFCYLPAEILSSAIEVYRKCLADDRVAPGKDGKRAFLRGVLERDDFLPPELQSEVDSRRGEMPLGDYLREHPRFNREFSRFY